MEALENPVSWVWLIDNSQRLSPNKLAEKVKEGIKQITLIPSDDCISNIKRTLANALKFDLKNIHQLALNVIFPQAWVKLTLTNRAEPYFLILNAVRPLPRVELPAEVKAMQSYRRFTPKVFRRTLQALIQRGHTVDALDLAEWTPKIRMIVRDLVGGQALYHGYVLHGIMEQSMLWHLGLLDFNVSSVFSLTKGFPLNIKSVDSANRYVPRTLAESEAVLHVARSVSDVQQNKLFNERDCRGLK